MFEWGWKILQWPIVFALASIGIAIIYYYAPDAEQYWVWLTPGAVTATALWILFSLALKYYISTIGDFNETYGAIGAVMAALLWFYVTSITILIGAELNAEIEHASPYGKAVGEKAPGVKRAIGALAYRRFLTRPAPASRPVPALPPARPTPAPAPSLFRRALMAAIAAMVVFRRPSP